MTANSPWHNNDDDQPGDYRKYDYYDDPSAHHRHHEKAPHSINKFLRFLVFVAAFALLIFGLSLAFPDRDFQDYNLVRAVVLGFILSSFTLYWTRESLGRILRQVGIWVLIIGGLSLFYLYQSDFTDRFMTAFDPIKADGKDGVVVLKRSPDGHFWTTVLIDGVAITMMVDTGATNIVLSPSDAQKIGINFNTLNFNRQAETANGRVSYARYKPEMLQMGGTTYYDVVVTVNGSDMKSSLLGNTLLSKYSSIEIKKNYMYLRP